MARSRRRRHLGDSFPGPAYPRPTPRGSLGGTLLWLGGGLLLVVYLAKRSPAAAQAQYTPPPALPPAAPQPAW